jgi:hypothetical protein
MLPFGTGGRRAAGLPRLPRQAIDEGELNDDRRHRGRVPGKSAKFFQGLGYEIEFATDHNSGQLRRGDGPYLFIAEVPETEPARRHLVLGVADADTFELDASVEVVSEWEDTHWGTRLMTVRDPDGREWKLQAPKK